MFGDIVKKLRLSYNYSQVQLANELSVSKQTVSNWENNNILPSIEMLIKIADFFSFFYLMALISISLGVTNLLPIPGLDGGRLLLIIIEAIRRKPLKTETEAQIQLLGFSFLIMLSLYVTFNDVIRIF